MVETLLPLLQYSENVPRAAEIRALACKFLLGLSRDPTVCQIFGKLQNVAISFRFQI